MLDAYESARQGYEQALPIFREIKDRLGEANCLLSLGDVHIPLAEYETARERYEQALPIFRDVKDRLGEANCLQRIGDVHIPLAEYETARELYEQALTIFREIKDRLGEANCLQRIGNVHRMSAEYESAREQYEQSLAIQKDIGDRQGIIWSYYGLGQTFENTENYPQARSHYDNSIQIVEEVWNLMKTEEHKTSYFTKRVAPYESMISLLFRQGEGGSAYSYAERSKARSFLYLLGNEKIDPEKMRKGVSLYLVKKEKDLRREIVQKTSELMKTEEKQKKRSLSPEILAEQLRKLRQSHRDTLSEIKLHSPEYASLISVAPLSLEKIQALLREEKDTVLIEYYITEKATYLWVIDSGNIYPYEIKTNRNDLNDKIGDFRPMLSRKTFGMGTLTAPAEELYDILLKPIEKHFTEKPLIGIIPHGKLHYLPFEALMKNGKFLVERNFKFFYLPSGSSYKYCREKNTLKKEKLLSMAKADKNIPNAEKEAKELSKLYPKDSKIFTGNDATELQVRKFASYPDLLHFACHGEFNANAPLYSALRLAPDSNDDGRLEVHEIFQLELKPAYLVTLSACETHLGGIYPGDEIVGLTRAFVYAGTPSILASLWKVGDECTQKLMLEFYRALKTRNKTDALRIAKRHMIEKESKRHPYYWAAFVLMGDYR